MFNEDYNEESDNDLFNLERLDEIGPTTKFRLETAGFNSIKDLLVRGPIEISSATGMDIDKAVRLCNLARECLENMGIIEKSFISANQLYEKRKNLLRITTGSKNLDDLLGGGIESRALTEIYGEYGTGKTQLCHSLCINVQAGIDEGGLNGNALYIDTENTFRPERIVSISNAKDKHYGKILDNIIVAKAYNSAHQELIISESGKIIDKNNVKLVIVDSAIAHYRAEYIGRAYLSERQQKLNRFMHLLIRMADAYSIAVVATNQIQSSPDSIFGESLKPTGGNVVAHTSTYRIFLKRAGKNRIARMVDSPSHAERETIFAIDEEGIIDPVDRQ